MGKVCGYCKTKKPLGDFFAPPNDGRANSVGSSASEISWAGFFSYGPQYSSANLIYQKVFHSRIA